MYIDQYIDNGFLYTFMTISITDDYITCTLYLLSKDQIEMFTVLLL